MDSRLNSALFAESEDILQSQDRSPPGDFMFIGELAVETGVDPKTIRFYEREGLLSPPRHGRFRTYMSSDVRRLKDVLTLRRLGIGIAQIRTMIKNKEDSTNPSLNVNALVSHLETLHSRQNELTKQIEETSSILEQFKTADSERLLSVFSKP